MKEREKDMSGSSQSTVRQLGVLEATEDIVHGVANGTPGGDRGSRGVQMTKAILLCMLPASMRPSRVMAADRSAWRRQNTPEVAIGVRVVDAYAPSIEEELPVPE